MSKPKKSATHAQHRAKKSPTRRKPAISRSSPRARLHVWHDEVGGGTAEWLQRCACGAARALRADLDNSQEIAVCGKNEDGKDTELLLTRPHQRASWYCDAYLEHIANASVGAFLADVIPCTPPRRRRARITARAGARA